jgi:hypothetical protein
LCLLDELRPCFTAPGSAMFCGLLAGLAGQVRRRTVAGMLLGGALQHVWPHDRAHYFFARARWELDQLGLAIARPAVVLVVPPGADVQAAADDPVFRRSGRKDLRRRLAALRQLPEPEQAQLRQLLGHRRDRGQAAVLRPRRGPAGAGPAALPGKGKGPGNARRPLPWSASLPWPSAAR